MANKVILMQQIRSIIQYLNKGFSQRAICRELHMSRKTVTAYTDRLNSHALALEELQHLPDAELAAIVYEPLKAPLEDSRRFIFTEQASYFLKELKRTRVYPSAAVALQVWRSQNPNSPNIKISSTMTQISVVSSTIASIGYYEDSQTLEVVFLKSGTYQYFEVPKAVADEFINSPIEGSHGKHLNENIKGFYRYAKV